LPIRHGLLLNLLHDIESGDHEAERRRALAVVKPLAAEVE
jgi:hypothetical protein